MIRFIATRLVQGMLLLWAMSIVAFIAIFALGNPIRSLINPDSPPEVIERTIKNLGLDLPLYQQYFRFVGRALHGDFGTSYITAQPALGQILERFPATLELTVVAMILATAIGVPWGVYSGYRPKSLVGSAGNAFSILLVSLPSFWTALSLVIVFSIEMRLLPTGGRGGSGTIFGISSTLFSWDGLRHLILPAVNLSLFPMALFIRLSRTGVQETLTMPLVRAARAKGLPERRVLFVYVLRHILVPIVTVLGMAVGILLAFAVVTETIFSWPGSGKLAIDAIHNSDRPVILAYLLFTATLFVIINLVVDIVCAFLDPRIAL